MLVPRGIAAGDESTLHSNSPALRKLECNRPISPTGRRSVSNLNVNRGRFLLTLVFAATLCNAAPRCPDPSSRLAIIGGDTITGGVLMHKKPLKIAKMRLYSSTGKTAWVGMTDRDGTFRITHLPPDTYRLNVRGWGSVTIRLNPDLKKLSNGQVPSYSVLLTDNGCVSTMEVVN